MNHNTTANGTDSRLEVSTQAVEAEIRDRADPRQVLADRVAQLYRQMPIAIGATFIAGAIATFELQGRWLKELVLIWWAIVVTYSAAASLLLYAYHRSADKVGTASRSGCAGSASPRSATARAGASPAGCFSARCRTSSRCSSPSSSPAWPRSASRCTPPRGRSSPSTRPESSARSSTSCSPSAIACSSRSRCWCRCSTSINVAIAYRLTQVFHSGYRLRHAYGKLAQDHRLLNQRLETQLVELEEARRQVEASGRKLALFAERAPIAVLELQPDGTVAEVNHAAEMLFGYAAAELVGGPVKKLVLPQFHDEFDRTWRRAAGFARIDGRPQDPQPAARRHRADLRMDRDAAGQLPEGRASR